MRRKIISFLVFLIFLAIGNCVYADAVVAYEVPPIIKVFEMFPVIYLLMLFIGVIMFTTNTLLKRESGYKLYSLIGIIFIFISLLPVIDLYFFDFELDIYVILGLCDFILTVIATILYFKKAYKKSFIIILLAYIFSTLIYTVGM